LIVSDIFRDLFVAISMLVPWRINIDIGDRVSSLLQLIKIKLLAEAYESYISILFGFFLVKYSANESWDSTLLC